MKFYKPPTIPVCPNQVYKNKGWVGNSSFLGNDNSRTPGEWVIIAKDLAKEHGGCLPIPYWLQNNGYSGLFSCMKNHHELFKDIKQDNFRRTVEEWVIVANSLVKGNNGLLPSCSWLKKNGYSGLDFCIKNNPEKFSHIKKDNKRGKTPEEWLVIAEGLAKKNNGTLQTDAWLAKNGYQGLRLCNWKNPKLFSHLNQDKNKGTSCKDHILTAEKLAKENNGILPSISWLKKNGHKTLYGYIGKYPEKFKHIPKDTKRWSTRV